MSSASSPFTPRMVEGVVLLARGLTAKEIACGLGVKDAAKLLTEARAKAGVTTNRALVYVSLSRRWIPWPDPGPAAAEERGELEELVWAGLRFDVHDNQLPGILAPIARTTTHQIRDILARLREQRQLTSCGLIALGFPLGLLSGREGTHPPLRMAAPRKETGPWSGMGRTGPWKLTSQQNKALALLPESRSFADAAAAMGVSTSTYRQHLKTVSGIAGVCCLRSLVHRALQDGILSPLSSSVPLRDLTPELVTVWRSLVRDVPDAELLAEIVAGTGLDSGTVLAALDQLRAQGEPDWLLVIRGWAAGFITERDGTERPPRVNRRPIRAAADGPAPAPRPAPARPRPAGSPTDRLRLLPVHRTAAAPGPDRAAGPALGPDVRTGLDVDIVCVPPDVCQRLLSELPRREWGPVIGHVEAANALLLTRPGILRPGWRTGRGRLWQQGRTLPLPPHGRAAPGGSYWAVSSDAPLWHPDRLERYLNHPLGAGVRHEAAGGGR
ncbi:hypothetical protein [Streptomyces sp. NBRC 110465]|uniref:hypothetical protein n=1 Tax=Streptomyces sp. NBRC 110465 TaxID=1897621 RepID=UPI000933E022|nr:hypothetical protein [Streptomyces sp. NBRC 110465]